MKRENRTEKDGNQLRSKFKHKGMIADVFVDPTTLDVRALKMKDGKNDIST